MDVKFSMCLLLIVLGVTAQAAVMDGFGNPINDYRGKNCPEVRCDWPHGVCTYVY
ncbi:small cysteine-rich protein 1-like [Oculina patagonica]